MSCPKDKVNLSALYDAAKLQKSEKDLSGIGVDLSELIDLADSLCEIQPVQTHGNGVSLDGLREDAVTPYAKASALVAAAPEQKDGMPRVPRVVEENQ